MKILSVILYIIGTILLVDSCFSNNNNLVYWTAGISVICLVLGCIFQYFGINKKDKDYNSFN